MSAKARAYLLVSCGLLMLVGLPFGIYQYQIARTAAFCDAVGALSPGELAGLATRCDNLMWERGGPSGELRFVRDARTLSQFALIGRTPYEIVVEKGHVGIKYFTGHWAYSDLLLWGEDYDSDGDRIRVLKIAYGNCGWRMLCERKGGHGEPDGVAKGFQPTHSETNSTSSATGPHR